MELKLLVRFLLVLVLIWSTNSISTDIVGDFSMLGLVPVSKASAFQLFIQELRQAQQGQSWGGGIVLGSC